MNNDVLPVTVTFTGTPQIPSLPPALPCGCDHSYLLSSQTASIASWGGIVGTPPANGALFIRFDFNSPGYWVTNAYIGCQWTTAGIGESVRLYVPCATNDCPCTNLTFICSVNKTQECGSAWIFDPPTAVSACCGTGATVSVFTTITNGVCPKTITRTWLMEDACGNSNTCSQIVTLVDTTPPQFTSTTGGCPSNKTVQCGDDWTFDAPAAIDACCGANVTIIALSTVTNSAYPPEITRTWQATDCCGNTASCHQTVTVDDTTPPVLNPASDKTVECGSIWSFDPPLANDKCCGPNPNIRLLSSSIVTSSFCRTVWMGVWQATDCHTNSTTCTQLVSVVDTMAPVFCGANSGANLVPNPGFETYSACPDAYSELDHATPWFQPSSGTPDFFHSCNAGGSPVHVPNNFIGFQSPQSGNGYAGFFAYYSLYEYREYVETPLAAPLVPGQTYEISFYVSLADNCIFAVDNIGAVFSVGPTLAQVITPLLLTPQIRNSVGNPLASKTAWMLIKGSYTAVGGETYLTIGNFYADSQTALTPVNGDPALFYAKSAYYYIDDVSVVEGGTNCCGDTTIEYGSAVTFHPPKAADYCCSTNVSVTLLSSNLISFTPPCQSVFRAVWQATDCCSNSATCTQTVTVVDSIAPYLCCPNDITVYTCSNSIPVKWKVIVTDNATSGLQATCNPPSGSSFPIGTTMVSCTATDACGNVGSCSFNVTVAGNQLVTVTKTLGVNDCYKTGNETAPVPKSATLLSLPGPWKLFDEPTAGKRFGASFMGMKNNVQCAQLWMRMQPNCRRSNSPLNDTLSLGFTNHPPGLPQAAWTNYIGGGNVSPGLITSLWCQQTGCVRLFSLDLANLPNGGANLLPLINSQHRLDILVEDSTTVDYAQLCYCYCPGKPLWRGLEWEMANAAFLRNCADTFIISRDTFTNFTVGVSPGEMRGISLALGRLSLGGAANKSVVVTGQRTLEEQPDSIRVSGNGGGVATISLATLRTNVTQIQVIVRNGTTIVAQSSLPLIPGTNLLAVTGDPLLTGIGSTSGGSAYQFTFESSHPVAILNGSPVSGDSVELLMLAPSSSSENMLGSFTLDAAGLDEIELTDARVQAGRLSPRIQGDAVTAIAGDVLSISSLNLATNNPIGFITGLGAGPSPTDPIWILPTTGLCRSSVIGPSVSGTTYGYIGNEAVPFKLGDITFVVSSNGWSISGDFANLRASGTRYQVLNQGAMVVDTGNSAVAAAEVSDLPNQWRLSAVQSAGHFIFNWPETQTFTVNGNFYSGDEMRLLPLGTNLPAYSITSLSVSALGVESLTLSTDASHPGWTLQTPAVTPTQMTIQWDGPSGGTLESSPTLFGPWTSVPGQDGNSVILGSPLTNGQATQFFRVRSN